MQLILWAAGTNGEGSSKVALKLIKALIKNSKNYDFKIFISSQSTLDEEIRASNIKNNSAIYKLPKIYRIYPIQLLIKFFLPLDFFCKALITLDDFPFRNSGNQILYFHQPNILYSDKFIWKLKRIIFTILLTKKIKIFVQTQHIKRALLKKFDIIKTINLITALHFDQ